jgi:hypothetical protein
MPAPGARRVARASRPARTIARSDPDEDQEINVTVPETLEATLASTERQADAALKSAGAVTTQLKKARSAAQTGQVRDLRKAIMAVEALAADLVEHARALRSAYDLDEQEFLASGAYTQELLATAQAADLALFEEDDRLMCYPSLVRVLPGDAVVEIDKVRERRIRPSVLVRLLSAAQDRPPKFKPEAFLDSLRSAYEYAVTRDDKSPDAVVRLIDVWSVLTILPGQAQAYSKQEFARDLYLLDQSAVTSTGKSSRQLRWSASTGTKSTGVLTTVARSGQRQRYWGVSFTKAESGR